jgi:cytochrome P450
MGLTRVAVRDDVIGGVRIRAGTTVAILIHGVHNHPGVWPEPRGFNPARFLPEAPPPAAKQALMPFGAGRRMCIAAGFASMEATLIVASVAQRCQLDLIPQPVIRRQNTFTGGPEGALWMRLGPRGAPSQAAVAPAQAPAGPNQS